MPVFKPMGAIFGWLPIAIGLVRNLPELIKLGRSVIEMFKNLKDNDVIDEQQEKALVLELRESLDAVKEEKSTVRLEDFHKRLSRLMDASPDPGVQLGKDS